MRVNEVSARPNRGVARGISEHRVGGGGDSSHRPRADLLPHLNLRRKRRGVERAAASAAAAASTAAAVHARRSIKRRRCRERRRRAQLGVAHLQRCRNLRPSIPNLGLEYCP